MTTWILLRAAGFGAYFMLFLAVAWGLVATTSVVTKRVSKKASITFHAVVASTGLALLAIHLILLVVDAFMPFTPLDVLVPMHSTFRPVAIALGVVGMYSMVLVLVSSWLRKPIGAVWWRRLHMLAVPAFTVSLAHGVFAGTDTVRPIVWGAYVASGAIVVFLLMVRALTARPKRVPAAARTTSSATTKIGPARPAPDRTPRPGRTANRPVPPTRHEPEPAPEPRHRGPERQAPVVEPEPGLMPARVPVPVRPDLQRIEASEP